MSIVPTTVRSLAIRCLRESVMDGDNFVSFIFVFSKDNLLTMWILYSRAEDPVNGLPLKPG